MYDWWMLYLQLSLGVLWVLVLVSSCYFCSIIRGIKVRKVVDAAPVALVSTVWGALLIGAFLVTIHALGGG